MTSSQASLMAASFSPAAAVLGTALLAGLPSSPALAAERGLEHLGWAHIVTARAAIEARVLVTDRLTPLRIDGRKLHQIWLPYHWGNEGLVTGDSANDLIGITLDPNVLIQESKVGTCDIQPGRRPTGRALIEYVDDYRKRADGK